MRNATGQPPLPPRTRWKRIAGVIVWLAAAGVCGISLGLASAFLYLDPQIPSTETYTRYSFKTPLRIYTTDGALIAEFGDRLIPVKLADVPQPFIDALLSTEDKRFYDHFGIDLISFTNDFINLLTFPEERTGASNDHDATRPRSCPSRPKQEFIRKFKEMLLALKVEQELSKDQILELYVNIMSFGKRAYGLQAAAHTYYGKPVDELSLAQLAMLAGIMKKPSAGNPINGPEWARERRNLVLRRMLEQGSIAEAEYRLARAAPITAAQFNPEIDLPAPYPAEWVRQQLEERYGADLYSGYVAYTTIDAKHQAAAQRAVRTGLMSYDRRHGYRGPEGEADPDAPAAVSLADHSVVSGLEPAVVVAVEERAIAVRRQDDSIVRIEWGGLRWARDFLGIDALGRLPSVAADVAAVGDVVRIEPGDDGWQLRQVPEIQGALVSLDARTGAVRALVGGWNFHTRQFNHALQGSRQPGSGFKPFVYSAALEQGVTPATVFWDAPLVFEDANLETTYRPRNDSGDYRGPMPLRQALYQSRNAVSIRVMQRVGARPIIDHARNFGFDTGIMPRNTQLAIGGGTMALAPIDMAAGYAAFANGGFRIEPHIIQRVERIDGRVVLEPRHPHACDPCPASEPDAPAPEPARVRSASATPSSWTRCCATSSAAARGAARGPWTAPTSAARRAPPTSPGTPGSTATTRTWWPRRGWVSRTGDRRVNVNTAPHGVADLDRLHARGTRRRVRSDPAHSRRAWSASRSCPAAGRRRHRTIPTRSSSTSSPTRRQTKRGERPLRRSASGPASSGRKSCSRGLYAWRPVEVGRWRCFKNRRPSWTTNSDGRVPLAPSATVSRGRSSRGRAPLRPTGSGSCRRVRQPTRPCGARRV